MNARMNLRPTLFASIAIASSLMLSACASTPSSGYAASPSPAYGDPCPACGTVTRIDEGAGSRTPNATGAVVGAVVGGLAAREIAKDSTDSKGRRNTATAAGAVAGAAIGNAVQNKYGKGYDITVRMRDGREVIVSQDDLAGITVGSRVQVRDGRAFRI